MRQTLIAEVMHTHRTLIIFSLRQAAIGTDDHAEYLPRYALGSLSTHFAGVCLSSAYVRRLVSACVHVCVHMCMCVVMFHTLQR